MNIERIPWDSEFFGIEIGRGIWSTAIENKYIPKACEGFDLVYLNQDPSITSNSAKNHPEAFDAGVKLTFVKSLANVDSSLSLPDRIIHLRESSTALEQLALISGHQSRYRLDPRFPNLLFEKLYRHWIRATIDGLWDASVLGFMQGNQLTGFVTVEFPESGARIGLVAVHPDSQGQGIGKQLIDAAGIEAMRKGGSKLTVSTQGTNESAKLTYLKGGFMLHSTIQQYHWWNPNNVTVES